jgi:hypothetical protein
MNPVRKPKPMSNQNINPATYREFGVFLTGELR